MVRGLRTVDHNDNATDPGEYLTQSWTADSRWQLSARLDPERGALVGAAIDAIAQRDGLSPADALLRLAEIGLAALADTKNPPRQLRGHERAAVIIHLDAARVPARSAEPDPDTPCRVQLNATLTRQPRSAERDPQLARRGPPLRPGRWWAGSSRPCGATTDVRRPDPHRAPRRRIQRARRRTIPPPGHRPPVPGAAGPPARSLRPPRLPEHQEPATPTTASTGSTAAAPTWPTCCSCANPTTWPTTTASSTSTPPAPAGSGSSPPTAATSAHRFAQPTHTPGRLEDEHAHLAPDAATPRWDGQRLDRRYAISVLAQHRQAAS